MNLNLINTRIFSAQNASKIILFASALLMIMMSLHYFDNKESGIVKGKDIASTFWYILTLRTHIFFGMIAMSSAPFLLIKRLRLNKIHRKLGYLHLISIVISSLTGLIIARFAMGGWVSTLGFSMLSILWLLFTVLAVLYATQKNFMKHEEWAIRSLALTFATIPQRLILLSVFVTDFEFTTIYQTSSWVSWICNLFLAELYIRHYIKRKSVA